MNQGRTYRRAHHWHDDKNSQQAIDHAGDSRQQINQKRDDVTDLARRELGEKNRARKTQRNREAERHCRRNQRAIDERRRTKVVKVRIPHPGPEKHPSKFCTGKMGIGPELVHQHGGDQEDKG